MSKTGHGKAGFDYKNNTIEGLSALIRSKLVHDTHYRVFGSSGKKSSSTVDNRRNDRSNKSVVDHNYDDEGFEKIGVRKGLNYINYSKYDRDIINNKKLPSVYSSFRNKIIKYEKSTTSPAKNTKYQNRVVPFHTRDTKHIVKNIQNVRNLSNLNNLKCLKGSLEPSTDRCKSKERRVYSKPQNYSQDSNRVYFKRKRNLNRRFNESKYSTSSVKRPQTHQSKVSVSQHDLVDKLRTHHRLENSIDSNISQDRNNAPTNKISNFRLKNVNINEMFPKRGNRHISRERNNDYFTLADAKNQQNRSAEIRRENHPSKDNSELEAIFDKLKQKVCHKFTSQENQAKALNRLELLKKYMSDSNEELVNRIKQKMTQELINNKMNEINHEKSKAVTKLASGQRFDTDMFNTLQYAAIFYDKKMKNANKDYIVVSDPQ